MSILSYFTAFAIGLALLFSISCGQIRIHRSLDPQGDRVLTTGIGGTVFRLNKSGDLPNAFGGRDIWGGKVDRGYAEIKLSGIEQKTLLLDIVEVNRASSETTVDRYNAFQQRGLVNVDVVQNAVPIGGYQQPNVYRVKLDTTKQADIVIAGVRVMFLDVQSYTISFKLQDLEGY